MTRQDDFRCWHKKFKYQLPSNDATELPFINPKHLKLLNDQVKLIITKGDTTFTSLCDCRGRCHLRGGQGQPCWECVVSRESHAAGGDEDRTLRGRRGHHKLGGGKESGEQRGSVAESEGSGRETGNGSGGGRGDGGDDGCKRDVNGGGRRGRPGRVGGRVGMGGRGGRCGGEGGGDDDHNNDNDFPKYQYRWGFRLENIAK